MSRHLTSFDTAQHHIYLEFFITTPQGIRHSVAGILDTGAPKTEFSDQFLISTGCLASPRNDHRIPPGLQTQKYAKMILPSAEICGHTFKNFEIVVSSFEASWGIDALVGLDFFRRVFISIDYSNGLLLTEPYEARLSQ
ncbi:MAG: hypothetical protein U9P10_08670 [Thermodesulfobacteriota bacterium]|nr:hypothetical protein [Thermodesulfobacteriota bacterium]